MTRVEIYQSEWDKSWGNEPALVLVLPPWDTDDIRYFDVMPREIRDLLNEVGVRPFDLLCAFENGETLDAAIANLRRMKRDAWTRLPDTTKTETETTHAICNSEPDDPWISIY